MPAPLAAVYDIPARGGGPSDARGLHQPSARLRSVAGHDIDVTRPQTAGTVIAKAPLRERKNLQAAVRADESVVSVADKIATILVHGLLFAWHVDKGGDEPLM